MVDKVYEYTCRIVEGGNGDFPCEREHPLHADDIIEIKGVTYRVKYIILPAAPALVPIVFLQRV